MKYSSAIACTAVIAITPSISSSAASAGQIIDRRCNSLCKRYRYASAFASLCTKFVSDISSIKIWEDQYIRFSCNRTLPGALDAPTDGTIAASSWNSPSMRSPSGAFSFAIFVASTTLSTSACFALPFVECEEKCYNWLFFCQKSKGVCG